jgi:hypothetical protein
MFTAKRSSVGACLWAGILITGSLGQSAIARAQDETEAPPSESDLLVDEVDRDEVDEVDRDETAGPVLPSDTSTPSTPSTPEPEPPAVAPWGIALGPVFFTPSAEVWARGEVRIDRPNGAGADDYFVASRVRLGLEARWEILRLFVQIQDARAYGQISPGTDGGELTGVHQGFLHIGDDEFFLRLGRQEYALGGERLIGPLNWANAARSFDALRLHGQWGEIQADVMAAVVRFHRTIALPMMTVDSEGDYLGVARFAWNPGPELILEPYLLFRHDGPTEPPVGAMDQTPFLTRERNIVHIGGRASGTFASLVSYELEAMIQTGRANQAMHLAFGLVGNATLVIGTEAGLSATLGANYGSGASSNGDIDEFDNFFPTNHLFYGYADYFGLRNMMEGWARVTTAPPSIPQLRLWIDGHFFAFPEPGARWTNALGGVIGQNPMNRDAIAGGEVDIELRWTPIPGFFGWAGYALFIPADGASSLGVRDPSHWTYLMIGARTP